ncbi:DUF6441 family protein [Sphingobium sp. B11D3A]|uniref:DUF6441 family protein n=1 Tax=Sphingobium sp. B11D3A TaxID=2940574 RepID=UPI002224B177|nr:DUF6441 family protein [Sphingobium sp. B11D3A]MCW2390973.1 hypothetical protein [Sphingobium sp. B11D3A]
MPSIELRLDQREIDRSADLVVRAILTQATAAVRAETRGLERDLEDLTREAAGGNLWRAWKSATFPRGSRLAASPAGEVFVNGGSRTRGAMTFWSQAGVNRSKGGFYLAIPTEHAGVSTRSRDLSPGEWERRNGQRLVFVYRGGGKPSLLVAEHRYRARNGRGSRTATSRRQGGAYSGAATETLPIFILIPAQRFANKFSIEPAVERRGRMLRDNFTRRMNRLRTAIDGTRES